MKKIIYERFPERERRPFPLEPSRKTVHRKGGRQTRLGDFRADFWPDSKRPDFNRIATNNIDYNVYDNNYGHMLLREGDFHGRKG